MTIKTQYFISDTFLLKNRGIVFTGHIQSGVVSIGDFIEFTIEEKHLVKRIRGIEMLNVQKSNPNNMGLLIDCKKSSEINELLDIRPSSILADIVKQ